MIADPKSYRRFARRAFSIKIPRAIAWRCLRDPLFSHVGTIPACVIQTDRRPQHYTAPA